MRDVVQPLRAAVHAAANKFSALPQRVQVMIMIALASFTCGLVFALKIRSNKRRRRAQPHPNQCVACRTMIKAEAEVQVLLPCTHAACRACAGAIKAKLSPIPLPPLCANPSAYKFEKTAAPPADLPPPKPGAKGPTVYCPHAACGSFVNSTTSRVAFRAAIHPCPEVETMEAGYALKVPFVLRQKYVPKELPQFGQLYGPSGTKWLLDRFTKHADTKVFGYDLQTNYVHLTLGDAVRMFNDKSLNLNFFDPPIKVLDIPPALCIESERPDTQQHSFTMTAPTRHTPLHTDPVSYGGGWMLLSEGEKVWTFLNSAYIDDLLKLDYTHSRLPDLHSVHMAEACTDPSHPLYHDYAFARGQASQVVQGPGDFIFFPYGWVHSVDTLKMSIGLAWYMYHPADLPAMDAMREHIISRVGREDVWPSISKVAEKTRPADPHGLFKHKPIPAAAAAAAPSADASEPKSAAAEEDKKVDAASSLNKRKSKSKSAVAATATPTSPIPGTATLS